MKKLLFLRNNIDGKKVNVPYEDVRKTNPLQIKSKNNQ